MSFVFQLGIMSDIGMDRSHHASQVCARFLLSFLSVFLLCVTRSFLIPNCTWLPRWTRFHIILRQCLAFIFRHLCLVPKLYHNEPFFILFLVHTFPVFLKSLRHSCINILIGSYMIRQIPLSCLLKLLLDLSVLVL